MNKLCSVMCTFPLTR